MSAFKPESYQEALGHARRRAANKPRKPKKRKKREKMPSRKSLIRKIDSLVFQFVCARDPSCVECGTTNQPTTGHVLSRRSFSTRWDKRNIFRQCWGCNFKAAMTAAASYHLWFVKKFGVEAFEELYRDWARGRKYTRLELVELVEVWEAEVAALAPNGLQKSESTNPQLVSVSGRPELK